MFLQHKVNRKREERSDTKNMGSADLDVVNARVGRAIGVRDVDAQQPEVRNRYLFFTNVKEKWAGEGGGKRGYRLVKDQSQVHTLNFMK
jgi:hypothetical protein